MTYIDIIDNAIGLSDVGDFDTITERLGKLQPEKLSELAIDIRDNLPTPTSRSSGYRFVGNTEMSALPYPCTSFECRDTAIDGSIFFASLYADELVLFNPFSFHGRMTNEYSESLSEISYYISKILALSPLIDRSIVTFSDFEPYSLCQKCFERGLAAALKNESGKFGIYFSIIRKFLSETEVIYDGQFNGEFLFSINNAVPYTGHFTGGYSIPAGGVPPVIGKLEKNVRLNNEQVIALGIASNPATYLSNDIIQTNVISGRYNVGNISTTKKQIEVMNELFGEKSIGDLVEVQYPLISQANVRDILRFRDQEWHHLHDFRKLIDEGIRSGGDVMGQLREEEVKLEKIVQKNRRSLNKKLIDEGAKVALSAAAAIGTGGISAVISAIVAAFGGKHLVSDLIPTIRERLQEPEELRDSPIYYAWKAKHRLRH